jgi:uncharacterized protein
MRRPWVQFALFAGVASALILGIHWYVWSRLVVAPAWEHAAWARVATAVIAAMALLTPTGIIAGRMTGGTLARRAALAAYSWMGVMIMLWFGLLFSEPLRVVLAQWIAEPTTSRGIASGLVALVAVGAVHGVASATGEVSVRRVAVKLGRLESGYRLVQLSDLHIGPTLKGDWLTRVVEKVNALEPDAVVITGDLVDGSVASLREHVAPLAKLRAKDGVFFVTGNHEYYSGADAWLAELRRLGVRPLRNERVPVGGERGFDLAGVDDYNAFGPGHGADLARALEGRDPSREVVLLAHQPRQVREAAEHDVGLQLSGHTHGGQIFPWNFFVRVQGPWVAGLYRVRNTQLYVSRGTGYWGPPMRVLAPSEITLLELGPA